MAARLSTMSRGQVFALLFGIGYLISGIGAFFYSDGLTGGSPDDKLLFFRTNYLHAIVHFVLGVGWLAASRTAAAAKSVNLLFGAILVVVALLGFAGLDFMHTFINAGDDPMDPENFLHLATGLLALYYGTAGRMIAERV
ncbi:MAG: DUF4383 domain-containing protein [Actinomycetota bacterium]